MKTSEDFKFMKMALQIAQLAEQRGEVPIGAVIVDQKSGKIVSKAHNLKESLKTPIGHAEIIALHRAAKKLGRWRLTDCTLYVTLEPCAMCAGALVQARLGRVVYATQDPKAGACESLFSIGQDQRLNHRFEISSGIMQNESSELLKSFFKKKRLTKLRTPE